jgi:hypothetical protein
MRGGGEEGGGEAHASGNGSWFRGCPSWRVGAGGGGGGSRGKLRDTVYMAWQVKRCLIPGGRKGAGEGLVHEI